MTLDSLASARKNIYRTTEDAVLNYVMIGTNDLDRSRAFYDAVLPHLGAKLVHDYAPHAIGYSLRDRSSTVWITVPYDKQPATPGNGIMPGFLAESEEAVCAAHAAALAHGGTNEGDPGPRPMYGPEFYGAYVRDPEGNKMSFIFNRAVAA
jgi:catechol 2,3-dioxygenase-like lactoylglutathione lyase family enzyme